MGFLDRVRYLNKYGLNRVVIRLAGKRFSPFAIVRHVGRRSGKRYATPLIIAPVPGGFMFELTYGPGVDWYRNILAAGECTVVWNGKEYALEQPETVSAQEGMRAFPPPARAVLTLLRRRDYFRMRVRGGENR